MKCDCGFKFSGPGKFRNCTAYLNKEGKWVYICPKCNKEYLEKDNANKMRSN